MALMIMSGNATVIITKNGFIGRNFLKTQTRTQLDINIAAAVNGTLSFTPKIGAMSTASIRAPAKPEMDWKVEENKAALAARAKAIQEISIKHKAF